MHGSAHPLLLLMIGAPRDGVDRLTSGLRELGAIPRATQAASLPELDLLLTRTWDVAVAYATPELDAAAMLRRCEHQQLPLILIAPEQSPSLPHERLAEHLPDDAGPHSERLLRAVLREAENSRLRRRVTQLERGLDALGRRHDLLLEQSADAYSYLQDGMHLYCNPSYATLFGYDDVDAVRITPLLNLVQGTEREALRAVFAGDTPPHSLTLQGRRRDGGSVPLTFRFTPVEYQGSPCLLLAVRDAASASALETAHGTARDLVTGLDNQAGFEATLAGAIHAAAQAGETTTLVLVSLKDYAELAAVLGKAALRTMLQDVARHLAQYSQRLARVGEHEFAFLLDESDPTRALAFCHDLRRDFGAALSDAVPAALELACEVGLALIDEHATTAAALLARARGLQGGPILDEAERLDGAVLERLSRALREQDLGILYQPLAPLRAGAMAGHELMPCLDAGTIAPEALRRAALLGGLGEALDRQVLSQALKLPHEPRYWFALSGASLQSPTFLPWLSAQLQARRAAGVPQLELSEIEFLRQRAGTTAFCQGLAQLGLGFAINHFGGTLDPCAWLRELHEEHGLRPALLKLDPALLRDLSGDDERIVRLRALIDGAHALELPVCASEVADLNLLPLLWQLGVDYAQGSALGAPATGLQHAVIPARNITITAGMPAARETTWH